MTLYAEEWVQPRAREALSQVVTWEVLRPQMWPAYREKVDLEKRLAKPVIHNRTAQRHPRPPRLNTPV